MRNGFIYRRVNDTYRVLRDHVEASVYMHTLPCVESGFENYHVTQKVLVPLLAKAVGLSVDLGSEFVESYDLYVDVKTGLQAYGRHVNAYKDWFVFVDSNTAVVTVCARSAWRDETDRLDKEYSYTIPQVVIKNT